MNNKGFTLVEILSVLILIGLLIGIGIPGVSRISNNMKQKSLNTKIKLVEEAGVFWGQDNKSLLQTDKECQTNDGKVPCKKISVNQLISEGYLDSESRDVIQYDNPLDNNSMLANSVYVYKKNNRVYAFYSNELLIQIISSDDIKSGNWHNTDFTLTILGSGKITYSWDNKNYNNEYTGPILVNTSTNSRMLYVKLVNGVQQNEVSYEVKLDKYPTISDYKISYNTGNSIATLRGIATDDINISQYKFTRDSTCNSGTWQNKSGTSIDVSHTFSNVSEQNRDYYFCVKDSNNQIKSSSALYPANCIVTGNFSCNETCMWSSKCPEYYFNLTGRSDNLTVQIHVPDEDSSLILNTGSINNFKIKESSIFYECDKNQVYITVYDKYSNTCFYHRNNDSNWDF